MSLTGDLDFGQDGGLGEKLLMTEFLQGMSHGMLIGELTM